MDDWDEGDDDWDDAYDEASEHDETGPCPECGADLHVDAEACYACGHWLTTAERHKLWDAGSQVRGAMGVGKVVLVLVLITLIIWCFSVSTLMGDSNFCCVLWPW